MHVEVRGHQDCRHLPEGRVRQVKICGEVVEKDIKPLGHDWDDGVQKGAKSYPTCKRGGLRRDSRRSGPPRPRRLPSPVVTHGTNGSAAQAPTPVPTAVPTAAPTAVPATIEPTAVPTPKARKPAHTHDFQLISDTTTCTAARHKNLPMQLRRYKTEESATGAQRRKQPPAAFVCSAATGFCRPHLRQNQLRRVNQQRKVTPHRVSDHVGGAICRRPLQVRNESPCSNYHPAKPEKRGADTPFLPYMVKYRGVLAFDSFCAALTTLCDIFLPKIMSNHHQLRHGRGHHPHGGHRAADGGTATLYCASSTAQPVLYVQHRPYHGRAHRDGHAPGRFRPPAQARPHLLQQHQGRHHHGPYHQRSVRRDRVRPPLPRGIFSLRASRSWRPSSSCAGPVCR